MFLKNKKKESCDRVWPDYYFYRSSLLRMFFRVIDAIGFIFFLSKPKIAKPIDKILVINLGGAGDLVISAPLLSVLSAFSGKKVDLVCVPGREKVLLNSPMLGKVFYAELPWSGGERGLLRSLLALFRLRQIVRSEKYDVALDVKGDPIIILLMLLSKITFRVGFNNGGLGFLLTHPVSQPDKIRRYKALLSLADVFTPASSDYNCPPSLSRYNNLELSDMGQFIDSVDKSKFVIVVHLGASTQSRRWPLIYWGNLLTRLVNRYNIIIIGSQDDSKALFKQLPNLAGVCIDLSGRPWVETARIIKKANIFIGANSGPAHLAAALGRPVISIFSAANDPDVWAPPGAEVLIFQPACRDCELSYCERLTCLKEITPAEVEEKISKILENFSI